METGQENDYRHIKVGLTITFTLGTVFNALIWRVPAPRVVNDSPPITFVFWLFANFANLILIVLAIPTFLLLLADLFSAFETRVFKPLAVYLPAAISIALAPQMFQPLIWFTTFWGAS